MDEYHKFLAEQSMNIASGEYSDDKQLAYETANYIAQNHLGEEELKKFKKDIINIPIDVE